MKTAVPATAPAGGCIRLGCCIPFCRRTFKNDRKGTPWPQGSKVICGKHWRMGSAVVRKRYARLKRMHSRGARPKNGRRRYHINIEYVLHLCFDRIARQATERAAGIA